MAAPALGGYGATLQGLDEGALLLRLLELNDRIDKAQRAIDTDRARQAVLLTRLDKLREAGK